MRVSRSLSDRVVLSPYLLVFGFEVFDLVVRDARLWRRQTLPRLGGVARDELDAAVRRRVRRRPNIDDVTGNLVEILADEVVEALARGSHRRPRSAGRPFGRGGRRGGGRGGGVVGAHQEDQDAEDEA